MTLEMHKEPKSTPRGVSSTKDDDPMVLESLGSYPDLCPRVEEDRSILRDIKDAYAKDSVLAKVLNKEGHHKNLDIVERLIYTHNQEGIQVLCIPAVIHNKRQITEIIIAQAHQVLGHFGPQWTAEYIQCHYWWPHIGQDIEQYCKMCPICQTTKSSTQRVPRLLHSLPVPTCPWQSIAMDFVGPFPKSNDYDYLWVIICHLTSMVHLVPIQTTTTASELT